MNNYLLTLGVIFHLTFSFCSFSQDDDAIFWKQYLQSVESRNSGLHPLDQWGLLEQKYSKNRATKYQKLNLKFTDDSKQYLLNKSFSRAQSQSQFFEVLYKNKSVLKVFLDTSSYAFDGKRLFFLTRNSYIQSENYTNVFYIDFERFEKMLGISELPIFRIAVEGRLPFVSLNKEMNQVRFGNAYSLPEKVLVEYSQAQHMAMQVNANLLDPKTYSSSEVLVKETLEEFYKAAKRMGEATNSQKFNIKKPEQIKKFIEFVQEQRKRGSVELPAKLASDFKQSQDAADKLSQYQKNNLKNQKLLNRIHWLSLKTVMPNPASLVKNIRDSLYYLYFYKKFKGKKTIHIKKGLSNIVGIGVIAASAQALLQAQLGISLFDVFYQTIAMGSHAGSLILGKIADTYSVGKYAVKRTFAGFNPHVLSEVYIENGMWKKTLTGLGAVTGLIYTTLGVPHLIVNTISLVKDMKEISKQRQLTKWQTFKSLKRIFIERQNSVQTEYERLLVGNVNVTPELQAQADDYLSKLKEDHKPLALKWLDKRSWAKPLSRLITKRNSSGPSEMKTFRKAFIHFLFSYSSFTKSGAAYSRLWNGWFGLRSFVTYPKTALKLLYYPRLFKVATQDPFHLVNEYNGGTRSRFQIQYRPKRILKIKSILNDKQKLTQWENLFLDIESKLIPHAMRIAREKTLEDLLPGERNELIARGGLFELGERKMRGLSATSKRMYYLYYQEVFELLRDEFVIKQLPLKSEKESLKNWKLRTGKQLEAINKTTFYETSLNDFISNSTPQIQRKVTAELTWLGRAKVNSEARLYERLSPNINTQVKRMNIVSDKVKQPKALARGVKSMIASNIVDKPLELMALLITAAGVTEGMMRPIFNEMFSADSWFYMSRYLFSVGFTYSVLSGVLAHVWMKVQQDELNEGNFDVIPQGKDKNISYLKWFWKQGMLNPNNSFWANQKHYWKIITANLRAALVTSLTLHFFIFKHFDIDVYLLGYLMSYGVVTSGLLWKLDQAFELSAGWFQKDIPEHLRKVPSINNHVEKKVGKARLKFNFIYKNFENIIGFLIQNFQNARTPELGSRSLMRVITGGETLTEIINRNTNRLSEVPVVKYLSDACNWFFVGKKIK